MPPATPPFLALSEELIACVQVVIAQQRRLIEQLEREGRDAEQAMQALATLEKACARYFRARGQLLCKE